MRRTIPWLLLLLLAFPARADDAELDKLRAEASQLKNQVRSLQKQLAELQRSLGRTAQRDDARKERLEEREARLEELEALVKERLPNTDRYPALGQKVEGAEYQGDLRALAEALAGATGVGVTVHRSVPKDARLDLASCDLCLVQLLDLWVKNARGDDGERLSLAWTWRASRGVEIRAVSGE